MNIIKLRLSQLEQKVKDLTKDLQAKTEEVDSLSTRVNELEKNYEKQRTEKL